MGTRSLTTVFDENNRPLLSLYRQYDGYYEGHGEELAAFLKERTVVNGFGLNSGPTVSNGMGCLAASLVAHFKKEIGSFYIVNPSDKQEYNYEIRLDKTGNGRITLIGKCDGERSKTFSLYADDILAAKILRRVTFVYDKEDGVKAKWRTVDVTAENGTYVEGLEIPGNKFKRFLVNRILGGKILAA